MPGLKFHGIVYKTDVTSGGKRGEKQAGQRIWVQNSGSEMLEKLCEDPGDEEVLGLHEVESQIYLVYEG